MGKTFLDFVRFGKHYFYTILAKFEVYSYKVGLQLAVGHVLTEVLVRALYVWYDKPVFELVETNEVNQEGGDYED